MCLCAQRVGWTLKKPQIMRRISARHEERNTPVNSCLSSSPSRSVPGKERMAGLFWGQVYQPVCRACPHILSHGWETLKRSPFKKNSQNLSICLPGNSQIMWVDGTITRSEKGLLQKLNMKSNPTWKRTWLQQGDSFGYRVNGAFNAVSNKVNPHKQPVSCSHEDLVL